MPIHTVAARSGNRTCDDRIVSLLHDRLGAHLGFSCSNPVKSHSLPGYQIVEGEPRDRRDCRIGAAGANSRRLHLRPLAIRRKWLFLLKLRRLLVREGRGFRPATFHYHTPQSGHCKLMPTYDLGYSFCDRSKPKKLHRNGAWPPKLQTMCNPSLLVDISMIRTHCGPLAGSSRPNATALWIVTSQCRTTMRSLTLTTRPPSGASNGGTVGVNEPARVSQAAADLPRGPHGRQRHP